MTVTCHKTGDIYLGLRPFGPLLRRDIRRQRVGSAYTILSSLINVLATTLLRRRISHNFWHSLSRAQGYVKIRGSRDTAISHWGGRVEIEKDRELKGILRGNGKGWSEMGAISRVNG